MFCVFLMGSSVRLKVIHGTACSLETTRFGKPLHLGEVLLKNLLFYVLQLPYTPWVWDTLKCLFYLGAK